MTLATQQTDSAMRSALRMPELFSQVLTHLADTSCTPKIDLLHTALACQQWVDPTLDVLWGRFQHSIFPLLQCLPLHIWEVPRAPRLRSMKFHGTLCEGDWGRFLANSYRIRKLDFAREEFRTTIWQTDIVMETHVFKTLLLGPKRSIKATFPKLRAFLYHHRYHERVSPDALRGEPRRLLGYERIVIPDGIGEEVVYQLCRLPCLHSLSLSNPHHDQSLCTLSFTPLTFTAPITALEIAGNATLLTNLVHVLSKAGCRASLRSITLVYYGHATVRALQKAMAEISSTYAGSLERLVIDSELLAPIELPTVTETFCQVIAPLEDLSGLRVLKFNPPFYFHPFCPSVATKMGRYWPKLNTLVMGSAFQIGKRPEFCPDLLSLVALAAAMPSLVHLNVPFECHPLQLAELPSAQSSSLHFLGTAITPAETPAYIMRTANFLTGTFPNLKAVAWCRYDGYPSRGWSAVNHIVRHRPLDLQRIKSTLSALL